MQKTNAARFVPKDLIPTDEQVAIQLATNKVVIIEANAGAAKTTTLALRLGEALARKLEPENMLALVFTPEARDVLKQRLIDVGVPYASAARIHVATYDDFAAEVLQKIEQRKVPSLAHSKDLKEYVLAALESVGENYSGKVDFLEIHTHNLAISRFIAAQLEIKATMALQGDFEYLEPDEISERLGLPLAEYLGILEYEILRLGHDENAYFRGPFDATYDLARQLDGDASCRALLPRYRLIICDELHDLNEASFRILQHLIDPAYSYFVGAGDKDQVIHSKLGASEEFMRSRFKASYPATAIYPLTYSYRHGPHLAYAMAVFKNKAVDSLLPLRTEISQSLYDADAPCAAQLVKVLERWKKLKQPLAECAILIRERHQSITIENALMQAGIAYRTMDMQGYLQREEILFLRGMIALALNNFSSVSSKKIRGDIFDALVIFSEVSLSYEKRAGQSREDVVNDPDALMWFFSARVKQGGLIALRDQIGAVVDAVRAAKAARSAEYALGELRQQLSLAGDFLRAVEESGAESQLAQVLEEVTRQVAAIAFFLESRILDTPPEMLMQSSSNSLQSLFNYLEKVVEKDVGQRMAKVVEYVQTQDADRPAHQVLRDVCKLMDFEALAKRLYVHPYEASVVAKSVAGFIAAAEEMQLNLREFSEWISQADASGSALKNKNAVLLACAANAKGKEFEHVLLPFLEKGEFPFAGADSKEEENLFYVAATRAKSCLTLLSPQDESLRSPYLARMKIQANRARADAQLEKNSSQSETALRLEFRANGDEWAQAKALGALWDFPRKVFYLKEGQDPAPFARWLSGREY